MSLHGHFWTIAPTLWAGLRPVSLPAGEAWSAPVPDPQRDVTLTGVLTVGSEDRLFVLVHGLGGSPEAAYVRRAARVVESIGASSLRLAVRGADRSGADIYHAGLTADLRAALSSPALARFRDVVVLGFSMGGHVALRYAAEGMDPRVRAVGAVCPPLDLAGAADWIDEARFNVYRSHLLRGLKEIYAEAHRRAPLPTPLDRVAAIARIREWDRLTVVPRFGFPDEVTYYAEMSAGPALGRITTPTIIVAAEHDPMIPIHSVTQYFAGASSSVTAIVAPVGGHVGWPAQVPLGLGAPAGLEDQVVDWLRGQVSDSGR